MSKYKIILFISAFALLSSCKKWLDVKPSDRITEENTFSTPQTFKRALNGIYIELNQDAIYGKALSCEFIDILAQYYAINSESVNNYELIQYNYTSSGNRGRIERIWSTCYNLIANVNKIIGNTETNRGVLSDDEYELIRGEALALRAFLHFDLFRLFVPSYDKGAPTTAIPYYTDFVLDVEPAVNSTEFLELAITDLTDAIELLKNDPIIEFGVDGDSRDNFKKHRNLRMNYYAAKALLARVYLYADEKEQALATAKEVIAVQERWFPWVKVEDVPTDQIFSTEILFALQSMKRRDLFTSLFDSRNINPVNALSPMEYVVLEIFDYQRHDYRYIANLQNNVLHGTTNYKLFEKYAATADSINKQMIPMIRMSEMYYIAAECEPVAAGGLKHLNKVRNNRGIASSPIDLFYFPDELLTSEYTREFWGEGQLFYFFKRRNATRIQSPYDEWGEVTVGPRDYVLPIPDGETKYN